MATDPSHRRVDLEEIRVLLSTLRVEVTPEAHFEERFLYDFRERLAKEAVCRSARSLFWEHVVMAFDNFGGRKWAFGATSFGLGALLIGALAWNQPMSVPTGAVVVCELEKSAASLRPGSSQGVVCTSVRHAARKAYTSGLSFAAPVDTAYLAEADDEMDMRSVQGVQEGAGLWDADATASEIYFP